LSNTLSTYRRKPGLSRFRRKLRIWCGMRVLVCLIITTLSCASALAQAPDARRRTYPTQDGFLEVDPRTGAITECKRAPDGYRCQRVTEGDALLKEDSGPQAQAPAVPRQPPNAGRSVTPSEEEIDRALDVMERFLRRFLDVVREGRPERT
jgi:hypothetical protein